MKYELKKMLGIMQFKCLIIISFIIPFIITAYFIHNYEGYIIKNNKVEYVDGYTGLKNSLEIESKQKGYLKSEKLNTILDFVKKNYNKENSISISEAKYPGYYPILYGAYTSKINDNGGIEKASTDKFYNEVEKRCVETYNTEKKEMIYEYFNKIKKPFYKGITSTWILSLKNMYVSAIAVMIFAILMNSMMFSTEKEMDMEYIYKNIDRNKLKKIKKYKFFTSISVVSIVFLVAVISSSLPLIFTGFEGYRSSIQVLPMMITSLYPWSLGFTFIVYIAICYTNVLIIMGITQCVDYILKNKLATILIMLSMLFISFQIKRYFLTDTTESWMMYLPVMSIDFLRYMRMIPQNILNIPILPIINIIILIFLEKIYFYIDVINYKRR